MLLRGASPMSPSDPHLLLSVTVAVGVAVPPADSLVGIPRVQPANRFKINYCAADFEDTVRLAL